MENKPSVLIQRYEIGRQLGQGTFAKVYYGRSIRTNQSVAIKLIDKDKVLRVGLMEQIKREISVMRLARHPNVVQLFEVMATKTKIYFIMEYCKGGELFNKVAKGKLKEDLARKYFHQLINAVDFCHSRGVYHRDIKPENLLLDENENLKVSDFGLSALADCKHQDGLLHTTCGTPAYVAPEVINRRGYDGAKADIWSCGVVLFVLLAGYLPFYDSNLMEMYRKISKADFKFPNWFHPDARRLILKMLKPDPLERVSIADIRGSSWFRKGLQSKQKKALEECNGTTSKDANALGSSGSRPLESKQKKALEECYGTTSRDANAPGSSGSRPLESPEVQDAPRPPNLNAFDLIALSAGFDLSGLFHGSQQVAEQRFTSRQPAPVIISKLEEAAKNLKLKIRKREPGLLKLECQKEGKKGILSVDTEIFQVTPTFFLVELKKSNGDTIEYEKLVKEDLRPALADVVWSWQGKDEQLLPQIQKDPQRYGEQSRQLSHEHQR